MILALDGVIGSRPWRGPPTQIRFPLAFLDVGSDERTCGTRRKSGVSRSPFRFVASEPPALSDRFCISWLGLHFLPVHEMQERLQLSVGVHARLVGCSCSG